MADDSNLVLTTGEMMTRQCYYCSYPNRDDATRCINCGMELKTYWDKSGDRPRLVRDRENGG